MSQRFLGLRVGIATHCQLAVLHIVVNGARDCTVYSELTGSGGQKQQDNGLRFLAHRLYPVGSVEVYR